MEGKVCLNLSCDCLDNFQDEVKRGFFGGFEKAVVRLN